MDHHSVDHSVDHLGYWRVDWLESTKVDRMAEWTGRLKAGK